MVVFWWRFCILRLPIPSLNPWIYTIDSTVVCCGGHTRIFDWFFRTGVCMVGHTNALLWIADLAPFGRMDADCRHGFDGPRHHD